MKMKNSLLQSSKEVKKKKNYFKFQLIYLLVVFNYIFRKSIMFHFGQIIFAHSN